MRKCLILAIAASMLSGSILANEVAVKYDCKFVANKDIFSKKQHRKIDEFIAKREKMSAAAFVKALGGSKQDIKMAVNNIKVEPSNFSVDPKKFKSHDTLKISGTCHIQHAANFDKNPKISKEKYAQLVDFMAQNNIKSIENYIAGLAGYHTVVDRDVSVMSDMN